MTPATGIPPDELRLRRETLLQQVLGQGLTGYVLFDESYIRYFTDFGFLATERPVAFVAHRPGRRWPSSCPSSRSSASAPRPTSSGSSPTRSTGP